MPPERLVSDVSTHRGAPRPRDQHPHGEATPSHGPRPFRKPALGHGTGTTGLGPGEAGGAAPPKDHPSGRQARRQRGQTLPAGGGKACEGAGVARGRAAAGLGHTGLAVPGSTRLSARLGPGRTAHGQQQSLRAVLIHSNKCDPKAFQECLLDVFCSRFLLYVFYWLF